MIDGTCEGCFYAVPGVGDNAALVTKCHRFPPVVFVHDGEVAQSFPDAWLRCGEYKDQRGPLERLKAFMEEHEQAFPNVVDATSDTSLPETEPED